MHIKAIRTDIITPGAVDLTGLLDAALGQLPALPEKSVLAITSKIVSLCEGRVVPFEEADKDSLLAAHADLILPAEYSKYGHHFTITNNTLIPMAGIDESNSGGYYVLWPEDAQVTANNVRAYLKQRFGVRHVGVIITDSTSQPLRRGTTGIVLAHSGFLALRNYIGQPDLFGRPFATSQANVAAGLAAAAVLEMGEGTEQTPLAILTELPFVTFQDADPSPEELAEVYIKLEDDLFAPFLQPAAWQSGRAAAADSGVKPA